MKPFILALQKGIFWFSIRWYPVAVLVIAGVWSLAWLAPICMVLGLDEVGLGIYRLLAPHDHQLPQRSYFLFGEAGGLPTYSLEQILAFGADPDNLRAFIGNSTVGYKTALNHRMIAIFSGMLIGAGLWPWLKGSVRVLWLMLMLWPMLIDAYTHINSEAGSAWRENNTWAATLTGYALPDGFYIGTTLGTLNWFLRTSTGLLFGIGLVLLLLLYINQIFSDAHAQLAPRFEPENNHNMTK